MTMANVPDVRELLRSTPLPAPPSAPAPATPGIPAARPADAHPSPPATLLDIDPTRRHMQNLDALRILCMVVIIFTHVTMPYLTAAEERGGAGALFPTVAALHTASRFGVPCFMMISFFIYWHQLYGKGRSWAELMKRRFLRLFPAFVVWSLFYLLIHKLQQRFTGDAESPIGSTINWKSLQTWKLVLIYGKAEYHLYYLPVIMQSLLLIPLLKLMWPRPRVAWAFVAFTLAWWTAGAYLPAFAGTHSPATHAFHKVNKYLGSETALPLLVFPLLGMVCAGQAPFRRWVASTGNGLWWAMIAFGLALHAAECLVLLPRDFSAAIYELKPGRLVTALAVFVLFLRHPLMRDPWPRLSHYAFGMHFMHPAVILGLTLIEARLLAPAVANWHAWVVPVLALNFVLTFFITYALCLTLGRSKRLEFLVV